MYALVEYGVTQLYIPILRISVISGPAWGTYQTLAQIGLHNKTPFSKQSIIKMKSYILITSNFVYQFIYSNDAKIPYNLPFRHWDSIWLQFSPQTLYSSHIKSFEVKVFW